MNTWVEDAHDELVSRDTPRIDISYSGRFKGYNANVRYGPGWMKFGLAKEWKSVDYDIQKGVLQHLMCKIYGIKKRTMNIEMYEEFLKHAGKYKEAEETDPYLTERFNALNDEYFNGMMARPTIKWGRFSTTRLGSFDYADDTVTLSTALKDNQDMLDYVLYHELLHKKHQFTCEGSRTHHHTKEFREEERKFKIKDIEKQLDRYIAQKRREKPKKTRKQVKKRKSWFW